MEMFYLVVQTNEKIKLQSCECGLLSLSYKDNLIKFSDEYLWD